MIISYLGQFGKPLGRSGRRKTPKADILAYRLERAHFPNKGGFTRESTFRAWTYTIRPAQKSTASLLKKKAFCWQ